MKEIVFDPKVFICPPYWDCPKCKATSSFGVLSIHNSNYTRRCKECWYSQGFSLPELNKKLIYVDQFVISNMMKSIDPNWNKEGTKKLAPFWIQIFEKLDILSKLQLIVCPDSLTHYYESVVSPEFKKLKRLYELLSHGLTYYDFQTIERFHVCLYAENWLLGNKVSNLTLKTRDIIRGNVHGWQERLIISVESGLDNETAGDLKSINEKSQKDIENLFNTWRQIKNFNFEEQYNHELDSYGKIRVEIYQKYLCDMKSLFMNNLAVDPINIIDNPTATMMYSIQHTFTRHGLNQEEAVKKSLEFLLTDYLKEMPSLKISALMWTALARRASVVGQKKIPSGSIFNDVKTISNLLPYCDAMFVDKECASLLEEIASRIEFSTKIFSTNKLDEFFEYLDNIKSSMTGDHQSKVYEVYGQQYIKPFIEVYSLKD